MNVNLLNVETEDAFASLLELAANNDLDGFKKYVDRNPSSVDEIGQWYGRQKGSNQMVLQYRTPLMVAATYGSVDVLKLIVSSPEVDVNRSCGDDKSTALHCATSGGSANALETVKTLLAAGANPNLSDANGHRPIDVITVPPKFQNMKYALQILLATEEEGLLRASMGALGLSSNTPSLSQSPSQSSGVHPPERREYPVDPTLPDIKNSIYSTDEFRMFSFKVRPCSRAYSHDWTECPFVHPGENARRRDPRKYHYSCVPCPDFRKGSCRRGDMCEYAHGVFECWLHPAQYRTRLCKDGTSCNRRVCFFAHTQEELRPLYVSTGSAVPSPRSSASAMEFAAAMSHLPGSPSPMPVMPPSPFTPTMSPSTNSPISSMGWPGPQNVPTLHLPGSNFQSSRLRSSFNARDIPPEDLSLFPDADMHQQMLNANMLNRSALPKNLTPSNLDDLFSAESLSPRYSDQSFASAVAFSPSHKSAILNQFQQQNVQSPIKTNFTPRNADHSLLQNPFGIPSPGRMSPRGMEPISPMGPRLSMLARRDSQNQPQFRSLSSRDLGSNAASAIASMEGRRHSQWGTPPEWAVNADDFAKLKKSSSFELLNNGEEPDVSWVQSLVKESPQDMNETSAARGAGASGSGTSSGENANMNNAEVGEVDESVLGAWIEQMQLDQLMAQ